MRALIRSELRIAAPAAVVWDYVTDWPRQGEWVPLTRVEIVPPHADSSVTHQVGGRFRAWTGLGAVGFWDPITVTAWERRADGSGRCEILHTGSVVRGDAAILATADGPDACLFVLWERIDVPGGPVGAILWRLGAWAVQRGADRVVRRLARRAEQIAAEGRRG